MAAIFRENLGQNVEARGFVSANSQGSAGGAAMVGDRGQGFVAQVFQTLGILEKNLARGCEFYGFARAVKQAVPILLLELPDLGADCGLRAEYFLASPGEATLPSYLEKCNELIKVHWCVAKL